MGIKDTLKCCVSRYSLSAKNSDDQTEFLEDAVRKGMSESGVAESVLEEAVREGVRAGTKVISAKGVASEDIQKMIAQKKAKKAKYFIHPEDQFALFVIFALIYGFIAGYYFPAVNAFMAPYVASGMELCQPMVDVAAPIVNDMREALAPHYESLEQYSGVAVKHAEQMYMQVREVSGLYYLQASELAGHAWESATPMAAAATDSLKYYSVVFAERAGEGYSEAGEILAPYLMIVQEQGSLLYSTTCELISDLLQALNEEMSLSPESPVPVFAVNSTLANSTLVNSPLADSTLANSTLANSTFANSTLTSV